MSLLNPFSWFRTAPAPAEKKAEIISTPEDNEKALENATNLRDLGRKLGFKNVNISNEQKDGGTVQYCVVINQPGRNASINFNLLITVWCTQGMLYFQSYGTQPQVYDGALPQLKDMRKLIMDEHKRVQAQLKQMLGRV